MELSYVQHGPVGNTHGPVGMIWRLAAPLAAAIGAGGRAAAAAATDTATAAGARRRHALLRGVRLRAAAKGVNRVRRGR